MKIVFIGMLISFITWAAPVTKLKIPVYGDDGSENYLSATSAAKL